jgi:glycosyltransferase involved in cell wall biosynthesis
LGSAVRVLAHALQESGHMVFVLLHTAEPITSPTDGRVEVVPANVGTLAKHFPAPLGRGSSLAMAARLRTLARELRLDILEAPECSGLTAFLTLMAPPARIVVRLHTPAAVVRAFDGEPRFRFGNWLERRAIETADAVIANSRATLDRTREALDVKRSDIAVVPNAVAREFFQDATPDPAKPLVVFSGRLQWVKGMDVLVRAWPAVLRKHPEARLLVIGEDTTTAPGGGSVLEYLQDFIGTNGITGIDFTGFLPATELQRILRKATLAVFPGRWEGFGIACAEAMAARVPVVVSDVPALRALVQDGAAGLVTRVEDSECVAAAIDSLLADSSLRERLSQMARTQAERFRPERVTEMTLAVYQETLCAYARRNGRG